MVREDQIVTVYDEGQPRGLWRVGKIEGVIQGHDGGIRGARVCVQSKTGRATVLKRPILHLYPLEVCCQEDSQPEKTSEDVEDNETPSNPQSENQDPQTVIEAPQGVRPRRSAAIEARDWILGCVTD